MAQSVTTAQSPAEQQAAWESRVKAAFKGGAISADEANALRFQGAVGDVGDSGDDARNLAGRGWSRMVAWERQQQSQPANG